MTFAKISIWALVSPDASWRLRMINSEATSLSKSILTFLPLCFLDGLLNEATCIDDTIIQPDDRVIDWKNLEDQYDPWVRKDSVLNNHGLGQHLFLLFLGEGCKLLTFLDRKRIKVRKVDRAAFSF
jgi:hypothetical protein